MPLAAKRVAILVEDLYQDLEVWYPYYRLKEAEAQVRFIGTGKGGYKGKYGYPLTEHASVDRVRADEFDAVVVPGGFAPDFIRRSRAALALVREMDRQGKIVAGICHAGWVLVSANILREKTATCFSAIKDDVVNAGANFVDREVVRDGNLITSRTPDDLPAFVRAIIGALMETPAAPTAPPSASSSGSAGSSRRRRRSRHGRRRRKKPSSNS
jgi:protease I